MAWLDEVIPRKTLDTIGLLHKDLVHEDYVHYSQSGNNKTKQKAEHTGHSFNSLRNSWNYGIWAQAKTSKRSSSAYLSYR